jgi:hypothetical protein
MKKLEEICHWKLSYDYEVMKGVEILDGYVIQGCNKCNGKIKECPFYYSLDSKYHRMRLYDK